MVYLNEPLIGITAEPCNCSFFFFVFFWLERGYPSYQETDRLTEKNENIHCSDLNDEGYFTIVRTIRNDG